MGQLEYKAYLRRRFSTRRKLTDFLLKNSDGMLSL